MRSLLAQVAASILAMVLFLVVWQVVWVQRNELSEMERSETQRVEQDMNLLQSSLEFALAAGAVEQVAREITARGSDPTVEALALVDDGGQVVGSRLRQHVGLSLDDALGKPPSEELMAVARQRHVGLARISDDRRHIDAIYPVVLGTTPGQVLADRIGLIVAVYSLDRSRAVVQDRLLHRATELAVVALLVTTALLTFGQILVGRRVRALVAATERLAGGDFGARAAIPGADELAFIGAAFDTMAERVGEAQHHIQENEARFRALVEAAPVAIVRTDWMGAVLDSNAAWRDMTGGNANSWPLSIHPDDREWVLEEWVHARAAGRAARAECRLVRPDGHELWVQAMGVAEQGPDGPAGFINTAVDLTERRQAEHTRTNLEARLQQSHKLEALGKLASGVAHDFNNILTAILGNGELLAMAVAGQPRPERFAELMMQAAQRGRGIVRQILEFGRPGTRELREVSPRLLIDEVARFVRPSLPEIIQLQVEIIGEPPVIRADPDQLSRVLVNLTTNATQAMPAGGVMEIGARPIDVDVELTQHVPGLRPGPAVMLWVRDEGTGMNAETQARIFEPFFTTKPVGHGTGLGLAVVHGIVRVHGGGVVVESEPGRGTTFRVYLPASLGLTAPSPPSA